MREINSVVVVFIKSRPNLINSTFTFVSKYLINNNELLLLT